MDAVMIAELFFTPTCVAACDSGSATITVRFARQYSMPFGDGYKQSTRRVMAPTAGRTEPWLVGVSRATLAEDSGGYRKDRNDGIRPVFRMEGGRQPS